MLEHDAAGDPMDEMVIETAARDFVDYLFVSMGISAMVVRRANGTSTNGVRLKLNKDIGKASSVMERVLLNERENAVLTIPLVEKDSIFAYQILLL